MAPTSAKSITWLHLSDVHLCKPRTGWDVHRVLRPLLADLRRMQSEHGLCPDLIFFSGDLAFGNIGTGPDESNCRTV
jgi:predicted MPP superfamily phosphohydrolase